MNYINHKNSLKHKLEIKNYIKLNIFIVVKQQLTRKRKNMEKNK